jgi:Leucine-rich repeat (LRR) protein
VVLSLSDNQLSDAIPPQLGNLIALHDLLLGNNQLSGPVPEELGNLDYLGVLTLERNAPSLCLPASLQEFVSPLAYYAPPPGGVCP